MPSQPLGSLMPSATPGRLSMVRRVPVGVVGAITPWNSPSVLGMRVVAPALALGNAVVIKPDPQTPVCGGAMFEAVFREAGLPEGLLRVVVGGADVGAALVTDPNVNAVSFTGSTAAGRRVGTLAGGLLKKVSLELGGNNASSCSTTRTSRPPRPPAPTPRSSSRARSASPPGATSSTAAWPRTTSTAGGAGEAPAPGRPVREEWTSGDRQRAAVARVDGIVRRSVEGGARLATGGTHEGLFYRPRCCRRDDRLRPGPTRCSARSPGRDVRHDEEALALANDSEYGWPRGVLAVQSRGLAFAQRIRSGMVHVNDQTVNDEAIIPFGGMGTSGNGSRFGGAANWDEFTSGSG